MESFILVVGFWILCGIAGGVMLSQYDEAGTGCLLGGLLGPIGLIIAWTMRDTRKLSHVVRVEPVRMQPAESPSEKRPTRKCPFCAEEILAEAILCRYCQSELEPAAQAEDDEVPSAPEKVCRECGEPAPFGTRICECGALWPALSWTEFQELGRSLS